MTILPAVLLLFVSPDAASYDAILKRHVTEDGKVRYAALKADLAPLTRFVEEIAAISPDSRPDLFPSREQKMAYWLNTYNALVLWAFAKDYPEKKDRLRSTTGKFLFFYRTKFKVGGKERSLDDIETRSIRKQFNDPRIHFAIVCASAGCPWISPDAFTASRLETQLEERTKLFLGQSRNVHFDPQRRQVTLSKLFQWFRSDFGGSDSSIRAFVARYRPEMKGATGWKVRYFDYDWSANDAQ